jgi:hypothetical protein
MTLNVPAEILEATRIAHDAVAATADLTERCAAHLVLQWIDENRVPADVALVAGINIAKVRAVATRDGKDIPEGEDIRRRTLPPVTQAPPFLDPQEIADAVSRNRAKDDELERDLAEVLNRHSQENGSNTPDFILAKFLVAQLRAFEATVQRRADWYGRMDAPGQTE